jgi:hypothetical protein
MDAVINENMKALIELAKQDWFLCLFFK